MRRSIFTQTIVSCELASIFCCLGASSASAMPPTGNIITSNAFIIAAEDTKEPKPEELIQNRFLHDLDTDKITIKVTPLFNNHYAVALSGELSDQGKVDAAKATAEKTRLAINKEKTDTILKDDFDVDGIKVAKPKDPQSTTMSDIATTIAPYLSGTGVTASVRPRAVSKADENHFWISLSGSVATQKQKEEAIEAVQNTIDRMNTRYARDPSPKNVVDLDNDSISISLDPTNEIKRRFEEQLKGKDVKVAVYRKEGKASDKDYVVSLSAVVNNLRERQSIRETARQTLDDFNSKPIVVTKDPQNKNTTWQVTGANITVDRSYLTMVDNETADEWTIRYLGGVAAADVREAAFIDNLIEALNATYATKDNPAVTRDGATLRIRGKSSNILKIKSVLALIDAPQPQVQMDFLAIQISGSADQVSQRMKKIRPEINSIKQELVSFGPLLRYTLQECSRDQTIGHALFQELHDKNKALSRVYARFFPERYAAFLENKQNDDERTCLTTAMNAAFTPSEALILMGVSGSRDVIVQKLGSLWNSDHGRSKDAPQPFKNLDKAFNFRHIVDDQQGVIDFLNAVDNYGAMVRATGIKGEPRGSVLNGVEQDPADVLLVTAGAAEGIGQRSAAVESMLKNLVEAVQADINELYLSPLKEKIRKWNQEEGIGGITLVGDTHMVVTTRQEAALTPTLVSSVETTRPAPFGKELLNAIAPSGAGGSKSEEITKTDSDGKVTTTKTVTDSADSTGLSGISKLVSGLPTGQAALAAAALLNDVPPTYSKVSPGISITIRPSMTPDGGTADLKLVSNFGVKTEALGDNSAREDIWAQGEPSAVQNHEIKTQAYVSGFDLFDISSFAVETSVPQSAVTVPILGRLPILGPAFQFPRGNKHVQHQSIVLVNAALLPSPMGLIKLYGAYSSSVPFDSGSKPKSDYVQPYEIRTFAPK